MPCTILNQSAIHVCCNSSKIKWLVFGIPLKPTLLCVTTTVPSKLTNGYWPSNHLPRKVDKDLCHRPAMQIMPSTKDRYLTCSSHAPTGSKPENYTYSGKLLLKWPQIKQKVYSHKVPLLALGMICQNLYRTSMAPILIGAYEINGLVLFLFFFFVNAQRF